MKSISEKSEMTATRGGLHATRGSSRSPPFVLIGLLVVISILAFNYWSVSTTNRELEDNLQTLNLRHVKTSSDYNKQTKALEDASQQNIQYSKQIEDLKSEITSKLKEFVEKEEKFKSEKSEFKTRQDELEYNVKLKHQELEIVKEQTDECEDDLENKRNELTDMSDAQRVMNETVQNLHVQINDLQRHIESRTCSAEVDSSRLQILSKLQEYGGPEVLLGLKNVGINIEGVQLDSNWKPPMQNQHAGTDPKAAGKVETPEQVGQDLNSGAQQPDGTANEVNAPNLPVEPNPNDANELVQQQQIDQTGQQEQQGTDKQQEYQQQQVGDQQQRDQQQQQDQQQQYQHQDQQRQDQQQQDQQQQDQQQRDQQQQQDQQQQDQQQQDQQQQDQQQQDQQQQDQQRQDQQQQDQQQQDQQQNIQQQDQQQDQQQQDQQQQQQQLPNQDQQIAPPGGKAEDSINAAENQDHDDIGSTSTIEPYLNTITNEDRTRDDSNVAPLAEGYQDRANSVNYQPENQPGAHLEANPGVEQNQAPVPESYQKETNFVSYKRDGDFGGNSPAEQNLAPAPNNDNLGNPPVQQNDNIVNYQPNGDFVGNQAVDQNQAPAHIGYQREAEIGNYQRNNDNLGNPPVQQDGNIVNYQPNGDFVGNPPIGQEQAPAPNVQNLDSPPVDQRYAQAIEGNEVAAQNYAANPNDMERNVERNEGAAERIDTAVKQQGLAPENAQDFQQAPPGQPLNAPIGNDNVLPADANERKHGWQSAKEVVEENPYKLLYGKKEDAPKPQDDNLQFGVSNQEGQLVQALPPDINAAQEQNNFNGDNADDQADELAPDHLHRAAQPLQEQEYDENQADDVEEGDEGAEEDYDMDRRDQGDGEDDEQNYDEDNEHVHEQIALDAEEDLDDNAERQNDGDYQGDDDENYDEGDEEEEEGANEGGDLNEQDYDENDDDYGAHDKANVDERYPLLKNF